MIEVICNDRLGKKVRVKCNEDDTIGDLKKLIAAQVGTRPEKIRFRLLLIVISVNHNCISKYYLLLGFKSGTQFTRIT